MKLTEATTSIVKDHVAGAHVKDHPQCPVCEHRSLIGFSAATATMGAEHTERLRGIGAQDQDYIHTLNRYPLRAGELHSQARIEASYLRSRAFDALPDFGTPRGTALDFHPVGVTFSVERERGIPAAWR